MTTPEPPAEQPADQPAQTPDNYALWPTRAAGFVIDILPLIILQVLLFWSAALRTLTSLIGVAYTIYLGHMEGVSGQTPGKAIMGIRLVDAQGKLVGSGLGIGRKFVHILDSLVCFLGWFLPLVDAKRQTIADKVLTTYVVTGAEKRPFAVELWTKIPKQES